MSLYTTPASSRQMNWKTISETKSRFTMCYISTITVVRQYCTQPQFTAQVVRHTFHIMEIRSLRHFSNSLILINHPSVDHSMKVHSKWYTVRCGGWKKIELEDMFQKQFEQFYFNIFFLLNAQYSNRNTVEKSKQMLSLYLW